MSDKNVPAATEPSTPPAASSPTPTTSSEGTSQVTPPAAPSSNVPASDGQSGKTAGEEGKAAAASTDGSGSPTTPSGTTEAAQSSGKAGATENTDDGYELEVDADSPISDDELAEFASEASRLGLKKEDAQKILAGREAAYKKAAEKTRSEFDSRRLDADTKIKERIAAHPDFSGGRDNPAWTSVSRALDKFAAPEVKEFFLNKESVYDPAFLDMFRKIGDALGVAPGGDNLHAGKGGTAPSPEESGNATLKKFYPDFFAANK